MTQHRMQEIGSRKQESTTPPTAPFAWRRVQGLLMACCCLWLGVACGGSANESQLPAPTTADTLQATLRVNDTVSLRLFRPHPQAETRVELVVLGKVLFTEYRSCLNGLPEPLMGQTYGPRLLPLPGGRWELRVPVACSPGKPHLRVYIFSLNTLRRVHDSLPLLRTPPQPLDADPAAEWVGLPFVPPADTLGYGCGSADSARYIPLLVYQAGPDGPSLDSAATRALNTQLYGDFYGLSPWPRRCLRLPFARLMAYLQAYTD